MPKKIRVRSKQLDQLSEDRLAIALWLMAKDLVVDKTTPAETETNDTKASGRTGKESA